MKLGLVSDIHEYRWLAETGKSAIEAIEAGACDVLVVAGDCLQVSYDPTMLVPNLRALRDKAEQVVYVPGNHEYYEDHFQIIHESLESACETVGIHFLSGSLGQCEIDGIPFIGGTLWFDFEDAQVKKMLPSWSDNCIRSLQTHAQKLRRDEMDAFKKHVTPKSVVVTHFLPSQKSVSTRYLGAAENCLFVTQDADKIIRENKPRLWLHGHTHTPCDYFEHQTRVLCKPLGYPRENVGLKKMPFIIEL